MLGAKANVLNVLDFDTFKLITGVDNFKVSTTKSSGNVCLMFIEDSALHVDIRVDQNRQLVIVYHKL